MIDRKVLKQKAKQQLGNGIFQQAWMMGLLMLFLVAVIGTLAGSVTFGLGSFLLVGPLTAGASYAFLKQARGKDMEIGDLLYAFKTCFGETFILAIMMCIFVILWSLLLFIPGIIAAYSYEFAFLIKMDHPELDWYSCIQASKRMTKGHKWHLFVLDLSFIGWYIVGSLCFGIGGLWVAPYHTATKVQYYEALVAQENNVTNS